MDTTDVGGYYAAFGDGEWQRLERDEGVVEFEVTRDAGSAPADVRPDPRHRRWTGPLRGPTADNGFTAMVVASLAGEPDGVPVEYFTFRVTPGTYTASG